MELNMTRILAAIACCCAALGATAANAGSNSNGYQTLDEYAPAPRAQAYTDYRQSEFAVINGESFHQALDRWARMAGWQPVSWTLPPETDFTVGASASFGSDFSAAIKSLMKAIPDNAYIRIRLHHANRVIIVEANQ